MSYDKRMDNLPLFISFPRCGSHWINAVSELYFDRPRLREGRTTFLDRKRKDWMWFHDHDLDLRLKRDKVLYLYRDPVDVMYSDTISGKGVVDNVFVSNRLDLYLRHLKKYLSNKNNTIIKYENFKKDFNDEFRKVVDFFDKPFDEDCLNEARSAVNKESLISRSKDKKYIGEKLISKDYALKREEFKNEFTKEIEEKVMESGIEYLLDRDSI